LAIAGIKGGQRAEITSQTTTIVLESANFNPKSVRLASRNLGLETDASLRFAHGLDREQTLIIAERAANLIVQITGGQKINGAIDYHPFPIKPKTIILTPEQAQNLMGAEIQTARTKKILNSLGFLVRKGIKTNLEVTIPTWRADITIPQDLVEEIGRIDGYNKITPIIPNGPILPPAINYFWFWKAILRNLLISCGWSETRNYSFVSQNDCLNFNYDLKIF